MVRVACLFLPLLLGQVLSAQDEAQRLVQCLGTFTHTFVAGGLPLNQSFVLGREHPVFGSETQPGGLLYRAPENKKDRRLHPLQRTNLWALQRLLDRAEHKPSVSVAAAVLEVAAVGLTGNLYDPKVMQVRELAHWTLMRMDDPKVWVFLSRVAEVEEDITLRVAALRLLGDKSQAVFRPLLEAGLGATDPRVRLAAAEALYRMAAKQSFPVLVRALGSERHGVVQHALLHALARTLRKRAIEPSERDRAIRTCLRLLGNTEWRVEMSAVDMIAQHPLKESVPELIDVMERQEKDLLKKLVNRNASPLLQRKAWEALRKITGASLANKAEVWEEFWEKNKDNLEIVDRDHMLQVPAGRRTRATFYGIPVEGGEVAFVIDTSGSMDAEVHGTAKRKRRRRGHRQKSRLDHAKAQMQTAAQTMDPHSRYHLFTFANTVIKWNLKPVPPNDRSFRALTACLGRVESGGGTNVFDALMKVLDAEHVQFGERPKGVVDEVFVLSDGLPTAGAVQDPDEILDLVREINRYLRVRINTVYTGQGPGAEFMRDLAKQNGGMFVQK